MVHEMKRKKLLAAGLLFDHWAGIHYLWASDKFGQATYVEVKSMREGQVPGSWLVQR
jgi:hypothetical protein